MRPLLPPPSCDFCRLWLGQEVPGPYDFATRQGPWANGCEYHWTTMSASPELGVGKGQLWITADQVEVV